LEGKIKTEQAAYNVAKLETLRLAAEIEELKRLLLREKQTSIDDQQHLQNKL